MSSFPSSIPLLKKWEEYYAERPAGSIRDFAEWLLTEEAVTAVPARQDGKILDRTARVSLFITRLHRIMVLYFKPVTRELGFSKDHEFGILVQIALSDRPNKKELAGNALLEISTTVEITKRLAQKGLIKEEEDEHDRRSARVSITAEGRKVLQTGYEKMEVLYRDFLSCLSAEEQQDLTGLLSKMNEYHSAKLKQP